MHVNALIIKINKGRLDGISTQRHKKTNFDELMNMIFDRIEMKKCMIYSNNGGSMCQGDFQLQRCTDVLTSQNPSLLKDISDVKGWNNPSGYTGILSQVFFIPRDCEWISHWKEASYSPICLFYPSISERPENLVSQNIPIIPYTFISSPQSYPGEAHGLVVRFESWGRDYHPNNPHNSMPNTCQ